MSENTLLVPSMEPSDRPSCSVGNNLSQSEGVGQSNEITNGRGVVLRQRSGMGRRERHTHNGIVFSRPKSEYISPAGISALDIRTRLRITEAELAIVQRELSDLLAERSLLEVSSRQYEESWRFTVTEFGRVVEQRDELQKKYDSLEQAVTAAAHSTPTEMKGKKNSKITKATVDQLRLSLEMQTRVAEVYEQERDRAYDDYEMAQVQLHTLFRQYQDLASSCSEVARERDRQKAEVQLLREELHRYDPDSDNVSSNRNSLRKPDSATGSRASLTSVGGASNVTDPSEECQSMDSQMLSQQLREAKDERERISSKYDQLMKKADQFQKQLYRAEEDRRQALATSEALTSLWQKKFDKAQNENYDLRQELLSAHERISMLQDNLAMARLQSRSNTPLRPSPPDADNPANRQSPVKVPSTTEGFWGSKLNSSGGSLGSSKESSLLSSGSSGLMVAGGMPQRTSSFHGFNQVTHYSSSQTGGHGSSQRLQSTHGGLPITRTASLKSPKELISPYSSLTTRLPHSKYQYLEVEHRSKADDEGSWI